MIHGNTEGIRKSTLDALEALYEMEIPEDRFLPPDLMRKLAEVSSAVNREISVYLSRAGEVIDVTIGGLESVPLADKHQRRNLQRLAMVRCIHTHPGGDPLLSDVDLGALKSLRLDAIAAVGVLEGRATGVQAAFLGERVAGVPQPIVMEPVKPSRIPQEEWMAEIMRSERRVMEGEQATSQEEAAERAVLVGVEDEASLAELARLADTAGIEVIGQMLQRREKPDGATYIGSGKAEDLALMCQGLDATMVLFDAELSGAQTRNLEELLGGAEVVDRTVLILAIFAKRAQSREGRLQVELAQLNYQLPRLIGYGLVLSRIGSGAGLRARGPGETRLELDRRRIRWRSKFFQSQRMFMPWAFRSRWTRTQPWLAFLPRNCVKGAQFSTPPSLLM
jgi:GTP-binding protein HflX